MAKVKVREVRVLKNHCELSAGFSFEIFFEAMEDISEGLLKLIKDIEWKLIYVGSAEDERLDQTLDNVLVGPVPVGIHKFLFETPAPDLKAIPKQDIVGLTVVLITCHYHNKEFSRVGYYVNNEYISEELRLNPPEEPSIPQLRRNIIESDPRITTFHIDWDNPSNGKKD